MDLLSVLGSMASIGAAVWAFIEAKKAAQSAALSLKIKNEMIDRRQLAEISKVYAQTNIILSVVSDIGPSCNPKKLQGINFHRIAKSVEEYARFLNEQRSNFSGHFENEVTSLCEDLKGDIEALSEASDADEVKDVGKRIYHKICNFMPFVKEISDQRQERSVLVK